MMAQDGAALMILGRKPAVGGGGWGQRVGPREPHLHQGVGTHTAAHLQRGPWCPTRPGFSAAAARWSPRAGVSLQTKARPCKTPLGPRLPCPAPARAPHLSQPPPLLARPGAESSPHRRVESGWPPPGGVGRGLVSVPRTPIPCMRPGSASPS